jgi:hypothetical protein
MTLGTCIISVNLGVFVIKINFYAFINVKKLVASIIKANVDSSVINNLLAYVTSIQSNASYRLYKLGASVLSMNSNREGISAQYTRMS